MEAYLNRYGQAVLTLRCRHGHEWTVRVLVIENGLPVPHEGGCTTCGMPGKLVWAERVD